MVRSDVANAGLSPDGQQVVAVSRSGRISLWPVDPLPIAVRRKHRELTPDERDAYDIGTAEDRRRYRERWGADRDCRRLETVAGMFSDDPGNAALRGMMKSALEAIVNSLSKKPVESVVEQALGCIRRALKTANVSDAELRELLPEYENIAERAGREER